MAISEDQLETWSHQGSTTQSASTYASVKATLELTTSGYAQKSFEIFLQGSYGNDTNIYRESDVDIIIRLDSSYSHNLSELSPEQQSLFHAHAINATYDLSDFKKDVLRILTQAYGSDVTDGEKAIQIAARNNRRKTDVIVALQHRKYIRFTSSYDQNYVEGIEFETKQGVRIVNFPKQHSANLTTKHQATSLWLKPMVRIFKNIRTRMVNDGTISSGVAPSYFIEGLLYNVPPDKFGRNYETSFVNTINWLIQTDRSNFVCVNGQYYLLREGSPVTWRADKCNEFLLALVGIWNE